MDDKALSGVLMISAAAALAWLYFTGRLDGMIRSATARAAATTATVTAAGNPSRGLS